jgi:O-antigen/teichoic acid export membrane protein
MSVARDSVSYWISQVANFGAQFVTSIFVAQILGAERRGVFTAVLLANTLAVNLTNLGMQVVAMYFTGRAPGGLARVHTLLCWLVLAICLGDLLLILLGGGALRERVFGEIPLWQLSLALAALPFSLYFFAAQGVMTGSGRVRELSRFLLIYSLAYSAITIAALFIFEQKVAALLAVWFASQVAAAAVLLWKILQTGQAWVRLAPRETLAGLRELLSYGLRAFVGNFATDLTRRNDQLFILSTGGAVGLGIYSLSSKLAELAYQPSASLENAGYARVIAAPRDEAARLVQDLFRTNFLINGFGVLILIAAAHPFFLIYGREFLPGVAPFRVLMLGTLMLSCCRMLAMYFSAQLGKPQIPSAIAWLALAVNAPLMWWIVVVKEKGLMGAACVTTACYALMLLCYMILFIAQTNLRNPLAFFIPQRRDLDRARRLFIKPQPQRAEADIN